MHYRFVKDLELPTGPWRITTVAYRYRLALLGSDLFRIHWHPGGRSPVTYPHLHAGLAGPEDMVGKSLDAHLPVPRLPFEFAVQWAIEVGVPPARDDWQGELDACVGPHLEHRSWSQRGPA